MTTSQGNDSVGCPHSPEHARLFAAGPDDGFAVGFDDTGADEQMLAAEFGVAHALGVVGKVSDLDAEFFGQLWTGRIDGPEGGYQVLDFSLIQQVLVNHHPESLLGIFIRV
jgi:hypothetical protein